MSAKSDTRVVKAAVFYRNFTIDSARAKAMEDKEGGRTIELAFSSEKPVRSYNWDIGEYDEILDHKSESVDLSRLNGGAPLLLEHNRHEQIGVIENARIDSDRIGRATVRFGRGQKASEIFQDVKEGIRSLVSVGYRIHEMVTEKIESDGPKTMRAIRWEPMEVSIVSIPADTSVGVGRSEKPSAETNDLTITERTEMKLNLDKADTGGGGSAVAEPAKAPAEDKAREAQEKARKEERKAMFDIAKRHEALDLYETALENDQGINEFRAALLDRKTGKENNPGTTYRADPNELGRGRTPGELFVASQNYRKATGNKSERGRVLFEAEDQTQFRATFLTTTGLTGYERPPGIVLLEQQPLTIAQLFAQGETSMPTVRFTREVSYTNAATAVAEEGQKPEATFDLEEVDAGVKKIAVIGRVTDEMFDDFPQVRDYVNGRLAFMVQSKEDGELLNGDGTSNRITGVLSTSNIQTQANDQPTIADSVHKALTKVRTIGFFEPDAIVMNPYDWEDVKLTKDSNGQYLFGGPAYGPYGVGGYTVAGQMWGKPVIATTAIAEGTALVGAFRIGGQLFRRKGLSLDTTNSDASDFQYNRIAIRAETRLTLAVYRPLAFCKVTGL